MATGSGFKIRKATKRIACMIQNVHERGEFIRMMISAQKAADNFAISRARTREAVAPKVEDAN